MKSGSSVGTVLGNERIIVECDHASRIRKVIDNGFLMGSMTGPVDGNPLVGFDIVINRLDTVGRWITNMKGMILQKIIMKSMSEAFDDAQVEIKEPKMKFELSLYRFDIFMEKVRKSDKKSCQLTNFERIEKFWKG